MADDKKPRHFSASPDGQYKVQSSFRKERPSFCGESDAYGIDVAFFFLSLKAKPFQ